MSKLTEIVDYMRQCPQLANLWSIAATENDGVRVILPQGASPAVQYAEKTDVYGRYECDIVPYPSVYEDFQINCYEAYDASDGSAPAQNINVLRYDEVEKICKWVAQQSEKRNLPSITGEKVVDISCEPFVPQIRYVNTQENLAAYFITVRIRYVNPFKGGYVEYGCTD